MEWYGGGPSYPRKIFIGTDKKSQIELYPPVFCTYLCSDKGNPIETSIQTLVLSSKMNMEEVQKMIEKQYKKEDTKGRLWIKLKNSYKWKLIEDKKKLMEEINNFDIGNLMLELPIKGIK